MLSAQNLRNKRSIASRTFLRDSAFRSLASASAMYFSAAYSMNFFCDNADLSRRFPRYDEIRCGFSAVRLMQDS